ncbi:hypothetical protein FA15DRAFT_421064 [Coprinopsis marcescibilis]|uniref:Uncharacterized protein n=1 Tax=Coprinopsis marcescibilis TaxID=230819 RepID=A0A5C3L7P7_COPMA|nr:hypothetical protein FA15DRAFT_421064 [Coprinopsis marcescibilis]
MALAFLKKISPFITIGLLDSLGFFWLTVMWTLHSFIFMIYPFSLYSKRYICCSLVFRRSFFRDFYVHFMPATSNYTDIYLILLLVLSTLIIHTYFTHICAPAPFSFRCLLFWPRPCIVAAALHSISVYPTHHMHPTKLTPHLLYPYVL